MEHKSNPLVTSHQRLNDRLDNRFWHLLVIFVAQVNDMNKILLPCMLILILGSCKEKKTNTSSTEEVTATEQKFDLPALPISELQMLYDKASYVDYIFYELPFSLSQDNQASIRANLGLMSPDRLTTLSLSCKPIGREFFQVDGEIAYEADLYFSEGCYGYVFLQNNKPAFANMISQEGQKFYQNIIQQAEKVRTQATNGQ